jgi:hypothetical protein
MVSIRFPDSQTEVRGLGFLLGRFSFKTFKSGHTIVPEAAVRALHDQQIQCIVEGPATAEQIGPKVRRSGPIEIV